MYKWNVKTVNKETGKVFILSYYVYKKKKEAEKQYELAKKAVGKTHYIDIIRY